MTMRCLRWLLLLAIASVFSFATPSIGQSAGIIPRVSGPIDETSLVSLTGNVPPKARPEFDKGEASPATFLTQMRLVLKRSADQQAALDQYDRELQEKSSPNYHKWLTPEQYGELYGPADSDVAALVAWLQSRGFTVGPVAPGRTNIAFSGTVRQVQEAFHTSIHSYEVNGEQFISNNSDPKIPSALAAVVAGIAQLNTLLPRPQNHLGTPGYLDPSTHKLTPASAPPTGFRPDFTTGSSGSYTLYVVPSDAATIYDMPNSFNGNFSSGSSYTGKGVVIGIGGDATIQASTVQNFRSLFINDTTNTSPVISYCGNYTSSTSTPVCQSSSSGLGAFNQLDQDEAYLDTELAGGLAPGATIHYYGSTDLYGAIDAAINDNAIDIFSLSFGECELAMGTSGNQLLNGFWQQAATQGIAVTVSTGDDGSAACDPPSNPNGSNVTAATGGLQVSGFASTPYNIAVGGTDFNGLLTGFTTYVSATNSNATVTPYLSAKGYIPESTWNDSVQTDGTIAQNVPFTGANANIVAGSGGVSQCSVSTTGTCTSGYAKPSWQRGSNVPNDGLRDLPDISLMAGNGRDAAAWLVCTDDLVSGQTTNCTVPSGQTSFAFNAFGGTSTSAPAFAGILAVVQESQGGAGHRLGLAAKNLYDLFNGAHASSIFHDITVGNNSVPCTSGSPNCSTNTAGNLFLTGYDTTTGYDLATGIGSVDVSQLITYWGTATGASTATVTVTPSATSITTSQSLSVAVTVTGSQGTPTGTVSLSGGGYTSPTETLTSGGYTFNIAAGALAKGSDVLTVTYSGDPTYASASQTTTVTVTSLTATLTLAPSATTITTTQPLTVTATVSGSGATPTGTVTLTSGSYNSGAQTLTNGSYAFNIAAGSLAKGSDTLSVAYSGDSNYGPVTQTTSVTVNGTAATVTVTPSSSTLQSSAPLTVTGSVTGSGGTPAGTVTLIGGGYTSAATTLAGNGSYSITIPANSLSAGSDTLTVTYSGDSVYNTATSTATVTVTSSSLTPTVTAVPSATTININQSVNVTATVTGSGGTPTGTVTLSGGAYNSGAHALSSGTYTFTIPASSLAKGADTLTVTYSGDSTYKSATGTTTLTVNLLTATVTENPSATNITTTTALTVSGTVAGTGPTPTGTVTLSGGGYTSAATTLAANGTYSITIPANSLSAGSDTLTVTYSGDSVYNTATSTATVTVTSSSLTPTVTAVPSATTININQGVNVTATVTGSGATPTGTVTLSGGYTSSAGTLTNGSFTFTIPAGSLAKGADTLTVTYSGDSTYKSANTTTTVTVNLLTATVSIAPSAPSIGTAQALNLVATVAGTGATPTGTVTLSGGGYNSGAQALAAGTYTFTVPAGKLAVGTDTLTVAYSGDTTYNAASNAASVTVVQTTFMLMATNVSVTAGAGNASMVTVIPIGGYTGTVTLTAVVTSSPAGAVSPPILTGSTVIVNGAAAATGPVTVATTAAPALIRVTATTGSGWFKAAGGSAIAALLLFFLPLGSRRVQRKLTLFLLATCVGLTAVGCGGGGGGGGSGGNKTTPSVTVTPAMTTIAANQSLQVAITVGGGTAIPTGTVTLVAGNYTSAATNLSAGAANIAIPANSLALGTYSLSANYSGDSNYNQASGTSAQITVAKPGTTTGNYTITVTGTDAANTTATTMFTLTVQ